MSSIKTTTDSQGNKTEAVWEVNNPQLPTVILLHGYGASMRDLAPLGGMGPLCQKFNWVFPDGHLSIPLGPYLKGRAWFPLNMEHMNRAMMAPHEFEKIFSDHRPEGVDEASAKLTSFIQEVKKELPGPLIVGGFSQGSMMACELVASGKVDAQSLLLLSSTLVARKELKEALEKRKKNSSHPISIFQSHGLSDTVLPVAMARELKNVLEESGFPVDYHEFPGGHEIPPRILQELLSFLSQKASL